MLVGFDQQIFRTTPPVNELVAKGTPLKAVAASGGGTMTVGMPGDPEPGEPTAPTAPAGPGPDRLHLEAPGVQAIVNLVAGGRVASLIVDGHELLKTEGYGPRAWGSFPMVPYAGRVRHGTFAFDGRTFDLPTAEGPHALHGTVYLRRWEVIGEGTIAADLGPDWPFEGRVVQRFELAEDALCCRLELHADEPMPASMGWHPWFVRRLAGGDGEVELDLDAGSMYVRDDEGIATHRLVDPPGSGSFDDCFTNLRRPPVVRWPGILELTVESSCPDWVVYTVPEEAICIEPQTAPPDALNHDPAIVTPGHPLVAEMTWRWRRPAG
jgi:galactose mutarotase-like enzyme